MQRITHRWRLLQAILTNMRSTRPLRSIVCWRGRMPLRHFLQVAAVLGLFIALLAAGTRLALAHPLSFGSARVNVGSERLSVELVLDVPEAVWRQTDETRRPALLEQVRKGFTPSFGGVSCSPRVRVVALGHGSNAVDVVEVACDVPAKASALRIQTSEQLGDLAIEVTVEGTGAARQWLVAAGQASPTLSLTGAAKPQPSAVSLTPSVDGGPARPTARDVAVDHETSVGDRATSIGDFLKLGFWHILPEGIDHILFVVSLTLLVDSLPALLGLLSLFTLGHAVSVAASLFGVARLDAAIIEPLIALSLAYAMLEVRWPRLKPLRWLLVGGFGLLHGLGFAGALERVAIAPAHRWPALLGFNIGVELGQLVVCLLPLLALNTVGGGRAEKARRLGVMVIGWIGIAWACQRLLF